MLRCAVAMQTHAPWVAPRWPSLPPFCNGGWLVPPGLRTQPPPPIHTLGALLFPSCIPQEALILTMDTLCPDGFDMTVFLGILDHDASEDPVLEVRPCGVAAWCGAGCSSHGSRFPCKREQAVPQLLQARVAARMRRNMAALACAAQ